MHTHPNTHTQWNSQLFKVLQAVFLCFSFHSHYLNCHYIRTPTHSFSLLDVSNKHRYFHQPFFHPFYFWGCFRNFVNQESVLCENIVGKPWGLMLFKSIIPEMLKSRHDLVVSVLAYKDIGTRFNPRAQHFPQNKIEKKILSVTSSQ